MKSKKPKLCSKCSSEMIKSFTQAGDILYACRNADCRHVEIGNLEERTESVKKEISKHISERMKQVRGGEK